MLAFKQGIEIKLMPETKILAKHKSTKPYSNMSQVINVFKISEDPMGFASKRILTKEDMKFLTMIKVIAERLKVLDDVRGNNL